MKNIILALVFGFLFGAGNCYAQDENTGWGEEWKEEKLSESLEFYKDKYELKYDDVEFKDLWNAVLTAFEDKNVLLIKKSRKTTDEGLMKGVLHSDYLVFSKGSDSTRKVLEKFSVKVPVIRAGVWVSGRVQFKVIMKEHDDESISLILKAEISGREDHVTEEVHFWKSNGYYEHFMIEDIKKLLGKS